MTGHERHMAEHGRGKSRDSGDPEEAESAVADAIESAVGDPSSIEEEVLLEAAEVERAQHGKG